MAKKLNKRRTNNKEVGRMILIDSEPKKIELFLKFIASGMTITKSCEYAMFNQATYFKYMNDADLDREKGLTAKESPFIEFSEKVNYARGELMQSLLSTMKKAAPLDWRAANALLEKINPEEYGKKEITNYNNQIVVKNDIPNEE